MKSVYTVEIKVNPSQYKIYKGSVQITFDHVPSSKELIKALKMKERIHEEFKIKIWGADSSIGKCCMAKQLSEVPSSYKSTWEEYQVFKGNIYSLAKHVDDLGDFSPGSGSIGKFFDNGSIFVEWVKVFSTKDSSKNRKEYRKHVFGALED